MMSSTLEMAMIISNIFFEVIVMKKKPSLKMLSLVKQKWCFLKLESTFF